MQELDRYTRKLAAILFTDMVGYTAVMQRDEMLAIQMQKRHQATVDSCVKKFGGEVKNDMGDGSMSILPSAIQVIKCAMAIQEELRQEPRVNIRVGIHIADVLEEESGKVHGDGINIASRIETLGVAGAILFSKEVYNKIKNQPEFKTVLVGSFPFKNVEEPMDIYAIANEGFSVPTSQEALSAGKLKKQDGTKTTEVKSKSYSSWWWLLSIPVLIGVVYLSNLSGKSPQENSPILSEPKPELQSWTGQVVHFDSRPAAGVILDINAGVARDTTGPEGQFEILLPNHYQGQQISLSLFYKGKLNLSHEIRLSGPEVLKTLKLKPEDK